MLNCVGMLLAGAMVVGQAGDDTATAKEYYELAEYWIGKWTVTCKASTKEMEELFRGKEVEADMSIEWSPTKRCQVVKIMVDGNVIRHALWGFDPKSKRWHGMAFNSDGSWSLGSHSPRILKAKWKKPFKTTVKGTNADGTPMTGEWTTTLVDQDNYTIELYEGRGPERKLVLSIHNRRKQRKEEP